MDRINVQFMGGLRSALRPTRFCVEFRFGERCVEDPIRLQAFSNNGLSFLLFHLQGLIII